MEREEVEIGKGLVGSDGKGGVRRRRR